MPDSSILLDDICRNLDGNLSVDVLRRLIKGRYNADMVEKKLNCRKAWWTVRIEVDMVQFCNVVG